MNDKKRRLGILKGRVQVAPDFDSPLPADVQQLFERALDAGEAVHEPLVKTRVQAALEAAGLPLPSPAPGPELSGKDVVLFLDLDGCTHPLGASRIGDRGQLEGDDLFRWWPLLREVLDEHRHVRVVVHSSWGRLFGPLQYLKPLLPADLAERVEAITDMGEPRRGHAVEAWLEAHADQVGAYVVLDDEGDSFASDVPLVLCHPKRGLSDAKTLAQLRAALVAAKQKAQG